MSFKHYGDAAFTCPVSIVFYRVFISSIESWYFTPFYYSYYYYSFYPYLQVCNACPIKVNEDFVQMDAMANYKPKTR